MTQTHRRDTKYNSPLSTLVTAFGVILILAFVPIHSACYDASFVGFGQYLNDILFTPFLAMYRGVTANSMIVRYSFSAVGLCLAILGIIVHGRGDPATRTLVNIIYLFSFLLLVFLAYFMLGLWLCR